MTQNWEPACSYQIGDRVRYNGCEYKIVQAHRSQSDWAPDVVPALWARVPNSDGDCHKQQDGCHPHKQEHKEHCHDKENQDYGNRPNQQDQQAPPQPQQQQQQPYQQVPPAPQPKPQQQPQYGDQQPGYGAIPVPVQSVLPAQSEDPRKQWNVGPLHISEDALKIGGGILGTAAAIGIGAFAFDKYRDAKEEKGDVAWGAENWLNDARRRQGEYLESIKADAHLPPVTWILSEGSAIPQGAIQAGQDARGEPYYIARAFHDNGIYIGKVSASQPDGCHIGYHGKQVVEQHYEILLGYASAVRWIDGAGKLHNTGQYRMVEGGRTETGTPIYVAQAHCRDNSVVPGGVSEETVGCHVALNNDESVERTYRFLTYA